ncbi:MAG: hypothetical protein QW035_03805 [Candidatus Anstonellales archaeon]
MSDIWNDAGNVLLAHEDYEGASQAFSIAAYNESRPDYYFNMAISYYLLSKRLVEGKDAYLRKVVDAIETARALSKEKVKKFDYLLALSYFELGKLSAAKSIIEGAYENDDSSICLLGVDTIHYIEELKQMEVKHDSGYFVLIGDPDLYDIYNIVLRVPFERAEYDSLKAKYNTTKEEELVAHKLNELYNKMFSDIGDSYGIMEDNQKLEGIIVLFVKGDNTKAWELVRDACSGDSLDLDKLPPYTRSLIQKFRSLKEESKESEIIRIEKARIKALSDAEEMVERGDIGEAFAKLKAVGFASLKGGEYWLSQEFKEAEVIQRLFNSSPEKARQLLKGALIRKKIVLMKKVAKMLKLIHGSDARRRFDDMREEISASEAEVAAIISEVFT